MGHRAVGCHGRVAAMSLPALVWDQVGGCGRHGKSWPIWGDAGQISPESLGWSGGFGRKWPPTPRESGRLPSRSTLISEN